MMMQAIVQDEYGTTDVLQLKEIDRPAPREHEVQIRVRAAAVNPADWFLLTGVPYVVRLVGFALRKPQHRVPGTDLAGEVTAVGKNVARFQPGDEVFGSGIGAFAEYACAAEQALAPKPDQLTFEQAAAVPMAALTALQALRDQAKLQPGQHILINGASGGIGTFAVQLAKTLGARVTGVCSTKNVELVRSLGADHVIDYTQQDFTQGTQQYDAILDNVANHSLAELRHVLAPSGTLIPNSGNSDGRWLGSASRVVAALALAPFVSQRLRPFVQTTKHADLAHLSELLRTGQVTPVLGAAYPLSAVAAAIGQVAAGHARGKVIVTT